MTDAVQSGELIVSPNDSAVGGPLRDLRIGLMSLTPENLVTALTQYGKLRDTFRKWLLSQMVRGVHYGYPPGCEPKINEKGECGVWSSKKNCYTWFPKEQWQPKESLYKAGADFVCDLLAARDEYSADMESWEQLGKPTGTFVMSCKLYSKLSGELLGEGRGIRKNGQKGGDENNAIKMAKKCAKVDAVLNTYGLSDLFTQDIEDDAAPPHDNPAPDESAPKAAPRGDRVTQANCKALFGKWVDMRARQSLTAGPKEFEDFVELTTGMARADIPQAANWHADDLQKCQQEIETQLAAYAEPPAKGKKQSGMFGDDGGAYGR